MYNLLENRKLSCCCYLEGLRTIFIRGTYVNPFQSAMVNKAVKALKKKKRRRNLLKKGIYFQTRF